MLWDFWYRLRVHCYHHPIFEHLVQPQTPASDFIDLLLYDLLQNHPLLPAQIRGKRNPESVGKLCKLPQAFSPRKRHIEKERGR